MIIACQRHDAEGVDVSPFRASCTQLATENCHQSRAICSDSNETAKRRQREKRRMRKIALGSGYQRGGSETI